MRSLEAFYASGNSSNIMIQIIHIKCPHFLARSIIFLLGKSCLSWIVLIVLFVKRADYWIGPMVLVGNELRRDIGVSSHTPTSRFTIIVHQEICPKRSPQLQLEELPENCRCGGRIPVFGVWKRVLAWIEAQWHNSNNIIRPEEDHFQAGSCVVEWG